MLLNNKRKTYLWASLALATTVCVVSAAIVLANAFPSSSSTYHAGRPLALTGGGGATSKLGRVPKRQHQRGRLYSSSDIAVDTTSSPLVSKTNQHDMISSQDSTSRSNSKPAAFFKSMDGIVFCAYLCNVVALSLPVLLVPLAATEQAAATVTSSSIASTVAAVSSIATLGGALGKFCNGFVCKQLGAYVCSKWYLAGLSLCSLIFSMASTSKALAYSYAGMEFFASMQWASLAVMLSNYYKSSPKQLAAALTTLGLSSTSGMVLAKTLGTTLSSVLPWRHVARVGAAMAFVGSLVIARAPGNDSSLSSTAAASSNKVPLCISVKQSLQAILTSKLFWFLGLAHSMAFATRGTERILGTFYNHVANVPQSIAGGLTLSITFGLVHGLVTGSKKFASLDGNPQGQKQFLARRYIKSFAATLGLAMVASRSGASLLSNTSSVLAASVVALLSGTMISNVAFQYYQFPALIGKEFGEHKAVCISFLDGIGFLLSAPLFRACGMLINAGDGGWMSAWSMLSVLFGLAGLLMVNSIGPILEAKKPGKA